MDTPLGVDRIDVETAEQMADAVFAALPADAAILVAAVADWRVEASPTKLKKGDGPPKLKFAATRDILAELGLSDRRPRLLVGFAAETEQVVEQAIAKRRAKRADWIVANDVSGNVMGGDRNRVHLVTAQGVEDWPEDSKDEVARSLVARIAAGFRLSRKPCSRVRRNADRAPAQFLAVEQMDLPGLIFADPDDAVDRQQGREAADGRDSAPSTPSSAQLSQSSASKASPTKQR